MNWETIDEAYERAKIYKGWLVREISTGCMVYIPDPMHGWTL